MIYLYAGLGVAMLAGIMAVILPSTIVMMVNRAGEDEF